MKSFKIIFISFLSFVLLFSCKQNETKKQPEITTKEVKSISRIDNDVFISSFEKWKKSPVPLVSAHRGGPYTGFPENAIESFENILKYTPVVIECDIAMTKDSVLVMMHDKTLDRTTTGKGNVSEATYKELQSLNLVDNEGNTTIFKIPTLDEVLSWGKGKVLFTLDVKRGVPFKKVLAAVEKHDAVDYAAIITYRVEDAKLVHELNKDVMISVSAGNDGAIEQLAKAKLPTDKLLGFVGTRQPKKEHYLKLQNLGIYTILGTLGNLDKSAEAKGNDDVYVTYIENGANILATDRPLEVAAALKNLKNKL